MVSPARVAAASALIALAGCTAAAERLPVPGPIATPGGSPAWTVEVDSGRDTAQPAETPAIPTEVPLSAAMGFTEDGLLLVALGGRDELRAGRPDEGIWTAEQDLPPRSWPFRLATFEDRVRVVLRGPGVVASYGLPGLEPRGEGVYCPEPRGLDADPWEPDTWWLACAGGELLHLRGDEPAPLLRAQLPVDLRDVVVREDRIWISRFQSAELLEVDRSGALVATHLSETVDRTFRPAHAYRLVSSQVSDRLLMAHALVNTERLAADDEGVLPPAFPCWAPVLWTFTSFRDQGEGEHGLRFDRRVVDLAEGPDGIVVLTSHQIYPDANRNSTACYANYTPPPAGGLRGLAVAAGPDQNAWVLELGPPTQVTQPTNPQGRPLEVPGRSVQLSPGQEGMEWSNDGVACEGCHPEGGSDRQVWPIRPGGRRTLPAQPTGPLGWQAQWQDWTTLLDQHAPNWGLADPAALERWLRALPAPRPPAVAGASLALGEASFFDLGCHGCHQSAHGDSDRLVWLTRDSRPMATPSLTRLADPGPFGHDGRYASLEQVFTDAPPGDPHHHAAELGQPAFSALTAWLRSR